MSDLAAIDDGVAAACGIKRNGSPAAAALRNRPAATGSYQLRTRMCGFANSRSNCRTRLGFLARPGILLAMRVKWTDRLCNSPLCSQAMPRIRVIRSLGTIVAKRFFMISYVWTIDIRFS